MKEGILQTFLPKDISSHGYQVDQILSMLHWFMLALFVFWFVYLIFVLVKFRARPGHKAQYEPKYIQKYTKGSKYLELAVVGFEVFLLIFFAFPAWKAIKAEIPNADDVVELRVTAEQFAWNIHYPGEDGIFGRTSADLISAGNSVGLDSSDSFAKDDLVTINDMHIPKDKFILVRLSSKDVIHSFGVPVLRVKQDAVPGMQFPVYFKATETGAFDIVCSQLCGLGHYRMKGTLTVDEEKDFKAWIAETKEMYGDNDEEEW